MSRWRQTGSLSSVELLQKCVFCSLRSAYQFAYKQGHSTDDAIVTLIHLVSKHLDKPKTHARGLFLDFSSACNTVRPDLLLAKMIKLQIKPFLIFFFHSFLTIRVQRVRVNKTISAPITTNVGAPQGRVSSLRLFTLYTDDCSTTTPNQFIVKYSDDSTLLSLLTDSDDPKSYQLSVDSLVEWCDQNWWLTDY